MLSFSAQMFTNSMIILMHCTSICYVSCNPPYTFPYTIQIMKCKYISCIRERNSLAKVIVEKELFFQFGGTYLVYYFCP